MHTIKLSNALGHHAFGLIKDREEERLNIEIMSPTELRTQKDTVIDLEGKNRLCIYSEREKETEREKQTGRHRDRERGRH